MAINLNLNRSFTAIKGKVLWMHSSVARKEERSRFLSVNDCHRKLFVFFCFAFTGTRTSRHGFINKAIRKSSWIDFMKTAFVSGKWPGNYVSISRTCSRSFAESPSSALTSLESSTDSEAIDNSGVCNVTNDASSSFPLHCLHISKKLKHKEICYFLVRITFVISAFLSFSDFTFLSFSSKIRIHF